MPWRAWLIVRAELKWWHVMHNAMRAQHVVACSGIVPFQQSAIQQPISLFLPQGALTPSSSHTVTQADRCV